MFNFTEVSNSTSSQDMMIVGSVIIALMLLSLCVYTYFVSIILCVFFTSPHVREHARYILFIHMIINDTTMLYVMILVLPLAVYLVYIPVPICYILCLIPALVYVVTPYNLAFMSLERYFAICYPLRHAEICSVQRSHLAIGVMWLPALVTHFIDFVAMCYSMPNNSFFNNMACTWSAFEITNLQSFMRIWNMLGTLALVGLVILFTYVKIMMVARKSGSGKSSAYKAEKTVLLHALQLGLCMMVFVASVSEVHLKYFFFLPLTNIYFFFCLPRFISPFIYGLRDEVFRKQIRKMNFFVQVE